MAYLYGSGHETVDRMANIAITGNVVPQTWYRTILRETGKPHLLAIMILSDLVCNSSDKVSLTHSRRTVYEQRVVIRHSL